VTGTEIKHRLAAILAADAAGYSRLMAVDGFAFRKPEHLRRATSLLRVAAGLEAPSAVHASA
jgi:hypothetical protein